MTNVIPKIICEIGGNHKGDFDLAIKMIEVASTFCDVDVIKFQKRDISEYTNNPKYQQPHPNPENSYGKTYADHRKNLEFDLNQHIELKKICESFGKIYSVSVWDNFSAEEMITLNPKLIKIPSALNLDFNLLNFVANNFKGEIHISLGMTYEKEIDEIHKFIKKNNFANRVVLYYCKSTYPTKETDLSLLEIMRLKEKFSKDILAVGFSGHHVGISVDIAALTLGANYFERHFTLDRTFKGTDHAASLEPDGLRRIVRNLREASLALKNWDGKLDDDDLIQRKKLKKL